MKTWQTACITDRETFDKYTEGEEVEVSAIVKKDWLDDFQPGNKIEVYLQSTTNNNHYTGHIIDTHGFIGSGSDALKMTVKRVSS